MNSLIHSFNHSTQSQGIDQEQGLKASSFCRGFSVLPCVKNFGLSFDLESGGAFGLKALLRDFLRDVMSWRLSASFFIMAVTIFAFTLMGTSSANAQLKMLNSNGYSGLGMIPSANVIDTGKAALAYEDQVPGHLGGPGFNYTVGFGVVDNLEASARLATDSLRCVEFVAGACPPGHIRDFSASAKYRLPNAWMPFRDKDTSIAFGLTDFGGASSHFSSKYGVITKRVDQIQVSLGAAKSSADQSTLHGFFGGVQWDPTKWSQFSYDQIGKNAWVHSTVYTHWPDTKNLDLYFTLHNRLNSTNLTERSWVGVGMNIPLSDVKELKPTEQTYTKAKSIKLAKIKKFDLQDDLAKNGFQKAKMGVVGNTVYLWVDQENYPWNAMDAAGVALGLLASTFGDTNMDFHLMVGSRGLDVLGVSGLVSCVKKWLENASEDDCASKLEIQSLLSHSIDTSKVKWAFDTTGNFRPELIISPTLINALGTEYSVYDIDIGANINPVVSVWKGGYLDVNAIVPLGIRTQNFNAGGPFYSQRIPQQISRQMFHQVFGFERINTQTMLSAGKIYQNWTGASLETETFTHDGKNRVDLQGGLYHNNELQGYNQKKYALGSYRYSTKDRFNSSTEVLAGKFWGGDTGFNVTERFWHGDIALNFYIKRTRLPTDATPITFAGFLLNIPLTPRVNNSFERLSIRGTSQFAYSAESKILATDNKITTSMSEIPKTGDNLIQMSNRDRTSDEYYQLRRSRLRDAYFELRVEDRKSWVLN